MMKGLGFGPLVKALEIAFVFTVSAFPYKSDELYTHIIYKFKCRT